MTKDPIRLGQYVLDRPIGSGAMGVVWRAEHRSIGAPVALKVVTKERARDKLYHNAILREVRSIATLNHPSIIAVYDHGEINAAASEASEGQLVAGSPYLVMDLATSGTLDDLFLPLEWSQIRAILLEILDALAHAHARGVIHRDLKPANVLVAAETDRRPGLKLTDFGLAHALTDQFAVTGVSHSAGTPAYMAPEQLLGQWREFGPWTDLYALGCMAYEFASGTLPFDDSNLIELAQSHLHEDAPLLEATTAVPEGFARWVQRLMAKHSLRRYPNAADAAWALLELGNAPADDDRDRQRAIQQLTMTSPDVLADGGDTVVDFQDLRTRHRPSSGVPRLLRIAANSHLPTLTFQAKLAALPLTPESRSGTLMATPPAPRPASDLPPLPNTWRRRMPAAPSDTLAGLGLGLFGMRPVPLVGRETERDLLWDTLGQVTISGRAMALMIRGTAGVGKSALAEWMTQRAAEVGAAVVVRANHGPLGGPSHGLPRMALDFLHGHGLSKAELLGRVREQLVERGIRDPQGYRALAIVEVCMPGRVAQEELGDIKMSSPHERHVVFSEMIRGLARPRPIVIWLDDVQWGSDALGFVTHLLNRQTRRPVPVLFLLTVRDEALASRPAEAAQIEALASRDDVDVVDLQPLADSEHAALIDEILRLDNALAEEVRRRTTGNPLFALQLVADWVERGLLVAGKGGFRLVGDQVVSIPDELHYLWKTRIDKLLNDLDFRQAQRARLALESAALLGQVLDFGEWRGLTTKIGVGAADGLLHAMAESGLAKISDQSWCFAHSMLRESLEREAKEGGRWVEHHARCAEVLADLYGERRGVAGRRAHHLCEAGAVEAALEQLLKASEEATGSSDYSDAYRYLDRAGQILTDLSVPEDDPRWLHVHVRRAESLTEQGYVERAKRLLETSAELARASGAAEATAQIESIHGKVAQKQGIPSESIDWFAKALAHYETLGDAAGQARCLLGLGESYQKARKTTRALDYLEQAQILFERLDDAIGLGFTLRFLAYCREDMGDFDGMAHYAIQAREALAGAGNAHHAAFCSFDLGMAAYHRGDVEEANSHCLKALDGLSAVGSADAAFPRLFMGALRVEAGDIEGGRRWILEAAAEMEFSGRHVYRGACHVAMMSADATEGDWESFDEQCAAAVDHFSGGQVLNPLIPRFAQKAAEIAQRQHQPQRATKAYKIALAQWEDMGRGREADRVAQLIEALTAT